MATQVSETVKKVLTEDVLTLSQARNELAGATGRRPDKATLTRWIQRGVGGVRLEAVRLGRIWVTSRQSLTRFIEATTADSVR